MSAVQIRPCPLFLAQKWAFFIVFHSHKTFHDKSASRMRPLCLPSDKNIVRIVGVSYIYKLKESPGRQNPELFEYRFNLKDNTAEFGLLPNNWRLSRCMSKVFSPEKD